jgi:hypothetical protein
VTIENINNNSKNRLEKKMNQWVDTLESLLESIPTLEVNTMIVDQIIPTHYIPEKIYQDIYLISEENLNKQQIHKSLWPSYLELRNNLELEYLILEPSKSKLPNQDQEIKYLLNQNRFLNSLKKMGEIKNILDIHNQKLVNQEKTDVESLTEVIYAQTKIHLDGVIINRYSQEILNHPDKEIILEIHRDSINFGQQQWRQMLQNLMELLQKSL